MLFAKGFVDWYKAKELADVVIITELQAKKSTKSRRTKSKDGHTKSSSTHIAKQEYYGHRIILSHHSKYFYQYFTKHQTSKEQSADERNSSSPTTSNNVDSCDVMSSEVLSGKSQMKASSTEDTDTGLLRLKIKFTNEKLFNFFPTVLLYLYGQSFSITEVRHYSLRGLAKRANPNSGKCIRGLFACK